MLRLTSDLLQNIVERCTLRDAVALFLTSKRMYGRYSGESISTRLARRMPLKDYSFRESEVGIDPVVECYHFVDESCSVDLDVLAKLVLSRASHHFLVEFFRAYTLLFGVFKPLSWFGDLQVFVCQFIMDFYFKHHRMPSTGDLFEFKRKLSLTSIPYLTFYLEGDNLKIRCEFPPGLTSKYRVIDL